MGLSSMVSPNRPQNPNFHQIYNQLGKPFSGTALDEFLNNPGEYTGCFNTIYNHQFGNMVKKESSPSPSCLSSSSSSSPPAPSLNFAPGKEEVWREVVKPNVWGEVVNQEQGNVGGGGFGQSSFQELLLRGFDADVVDPQLLGNVDPMAGGSQSPAADWVQFQKEKQIELLGSQLHVGNRSLIGCSSNVALANNSIVDVGYPDNQLAAPLVASSGMERKRRISDEMMDKTIERKQRRMIKNRESAARSRAKKQAYTNNLEEQVAQLRKANKMLMNEKELAALFPLEPKPQLRRTTSAIF